MLNLQKIKRLALILCAPTSTLLVGCGTMKSQIQNYDLCMSDPSCVAKMHEAAGAAQGVAAVVGGALADPISVPLTAIAASLTSLFVGIYLGKRKAQVKNNGF